MTGLAKPTLTAVEAIPVDVPTVALRGETVILDRDLARIFQVSTSAFNQAIKRNRDRFPEAWVFMASDEEFADLKSRNVIASGTWGGVRKPPWAFTEHGVVAAAGVLRSKRAIEMQHLVVQVFVAARRQGLLNTAMLAPSALGAENTPLFLQSALGSQLAQARDRIFESIEGHRDIASAREEALSVLASGIRELKAWLTQHTRKNDEAAARTIETLTRAELNQAEIAKIQAETEEKQLRILARKLRLMMEADRYAATADSAGLMAVLEDLGR